MTNELHAPRPTVDSEAISAHLNAAYQRLTPVALWTAIADIPVMLTELERLSRLLTHARRDLADLLAAGRATLSADRDGEADPLAYLRDAVAEHQAWSPPDDGRGAR
jgi:hypothetical protein